MMTIVTDQDGFEAWLQTAAPGDRAVYLDTDENRPLALKRGLDDTLDTLANDVLQAADAGRVAPFQAYDGERLRYLVMRLRKPGGGR